MRARTKPRTSLDALNRCAENRVEVRLNSSLKGPLVEPRAAQAAWELIEHTTVAIRDFAVADCGIDLFESRAFGERKLLVSHRAAEYCEQPFVHIPFRLQ